MKAAIFDIGNVVYADNWKLVHSLFQQGFGVKDDEKWAETWERGFCINWDDYKTGKMPSYYFWESALKGMSVEPTTERIWRASEHFKRIWDEPRKEVLDVLFRLRQKYRVYALTNCCTESEGKLARLGYSWELRTAGFGAFDEIYMSHRIGKKKPDLESYLHVTSRHNLNPGECVFVDDKERNTKSAESLGMKAVVFRDAGSLESELKDFGFVF